MAAMAAKAKAVPNSPMKKKQEAQARVLDLVAGDQLGLGHRHVERRLGELGLGGDEEEPEADELGEDERAAEQPRDPKIVAVGLGPHDALEAEACRPG